jgi:hypothetical protein
MEQERFEQFDDVMLKASNSSQTRSPVSLKVAQTHLKITYVSLFLNLSQWLQLTFILDSSAERFSSACLQSY